MTKTRKIIRDRDGSRWPAVYDRYNGGARRYEQFYDAARRAVDEGHTKDWGLINALNTLDAELASTDPGADVDGAESDLFETWYDLWRWSDYGTWLFDARKWTQD